MKNILAKIFGSAGGSIADKISGVVDKFVQTKDEKAEFEKEMTNIFMSHELSLEKEISERHKNDMQSDSWLSKNIRPLLTIFSLVLYTLFAITDGNIGEFNIANQYVDLLGQIVIMSLGFYFTSRGIEKTAKIIRK
jgi:hypothetical protein|tara:strand:- start:2559 stop:2966 length:408 start_codon:yes stop_codon:yes gene_type:complete